MPSFDINNAAATLSSFLQGQQQARDAKRKREIRKMQMDLMQGRLDAQNRRLDKPTFVSTPRGTAKVDENGNLVLLDDFTTPTKPRPGSDFDLRSDAKGNLIRTDRVNDTSSIVLGEDGNPVKMPVTEKNTQFQTYGGILFKVVNGNLEPVLIKGSVVKVKTVGEKEVSRTETTPTFTPGTDTTPAIIGSTETTTEAAPSKTTKGYDAQGRSTIEEQKTTGAHTEITQALDPSRRNLPPTFTQVKAMADQVGLPVTFDQNNWPVPGDTPLPLSALTEEKLITMLKTANNEMVPLKGETSTQARARKEMWEPMRDLIRAALEERTGTLLRKETVDDRLRGLKDIPLTTQ